MLTVSQFKEQHFCLLFKSKCFHSVMSKGK